MRTNMMILGLALAAGCGTSSGTDAGTTTDAGPTGDTVPGTDGGTHDGAVATDTGNGNGDATATTDTGNGNGDATATTDTGAGDGAVTVSDGSTGTTGTLTGTAQNFQDHTGLGGLTVTTCAATDVSCATPLATATTTTGTGAFTITYPLTAGAFNGYFQFTGGSGASQVTPTRTFLTLTGATSTQTFSLVPLAVFTGLSSLFPGVQFDSTHGAVTFAVQTAAGAAISGADVAASPSAGTPFYIASGLPSETATQTDSSGEGGFFSTAPGNYTFTAASADGGTIGSEMSSVRGGYITAFTIFGM